MIKCSNCKHTFEEDSNWKTSLHECPSCKTKFCDKPKTESLLFVLQEKLNDSNKDKIFSKMVPILWGYTCSILKRKHRRVFQPGMILEDKAWEVVSEIIEEYLQKPNYKVNSSFAGLINMKILWVLYRKQEVQAGSIRDRKEIFIPNINEKNFNTLVDLVKPYEINGWEAKLPKKYKSIHNTSKGYKVVMNLLIDGMSIDLIPEDSKENNLLYTDNYEINQIDRSLDNQELLNKIDSMIMTNNTGSISFLKKIIATKIYVTKGEVYSDKFFEIYGRLGKEEFISTIKEIKQELLNRNKA
jgi:DNA-directed RNA polymerase subunit RPC12/RpoP